MEAIKKFRENIQRVRASKYADLENKDKALKATTTILKIALYCILILIAIPVIAGCFIARSFFKTCNEVGKDYSQRRAFNSLIKSLRRW